MNPKKTLFDGLVWPGYEYTLTVLVSRLNAAIPRMWSSPINKKHAKYVNIFVSESASWCSLTSVWILWWSLTLTNYMNNRGFGLSWMWSHCAWHHFRPVTHFGYLVTPLPHSVSNKYKCWLRLYDFYLLRFAIFFCAHMLKRATKFQNKNMPQKKEIRSLPVWKSPNNDKSPKCVSQLQSSPNDGENQYAMIYICQSLIWSRRPKLCVSR